MTKQMNWAGNYEYKAARIHYPKTLDEVRELVRRGEKIRTLGSRHSFNGIADCTQDIISLQHFDRVIALDKERLTVTVEGGIRYGELSQYLHGEGYALHNLASLPHISVAGACATATHGSGDKNGNLATTVSAMELVTADGEVMVVSREKDGELFYGMIVGLGGFGVVTKLTLDIQPTYDVQQDIYENLPLSVLENHFDEITSSGYSVSLFTDWETESINQVWMKCRIVDGKKLEAESNFLGASPATRRMHPIGKLSSENCTEQMGIAGAWHERLPHFRMDHTPSSGEELQTEYFVAREHAYQAILAINEMRENITPLIMISEVRTIAADNFWMSPCYKEDRVALHFTWKMDQPAVMKLLPKIEEALAPFDARPHWGKLFTVSPKLLESRYKKLKDFRELLTQYDPQGKFRNAFLDLNIFGIG
ncbi:MAG: FAD-binding protein [Anaerolineales bacterium]|nr:FAD-binding protein [Anaerolineales bacterium]